MKRIPFLLVPFVLLSLVSCNGHSPTDPFSGRASLAGSVADPYGHIWGGVTIGIVHPDRGVVASAMTDHQGNYFVDRITPGHYRVWLQLGRTGPGYFVADLDLLDGHQVFNIVSR